MGHATCFTSDRTGARVELTCIHSTVDTVRIQSAMVTLLIVWHMPRPKIQDTVDYLGRGRGSRRYPEELHWSVTNKIFTILMIP